MANDLPRNGPSGWYSQAWMSRADQSLSSTTPNTCDGAAATVTGTVGMLGTPTTKPTSSSMSSRALGPNTTDPSGPDPGPSWPLGRTTGDPDTTTVPARPW